MYGVGEEGIDLNLYIFGVFGCQYLIVIFLIIFIFVFCSLYVFREVFVFGFQGQLCVLDLINEYDIFFFGYDD